MVYLVFDPVPLSSEMEGLLRRRKFALLHLRFRHPFFYSMTVAYSDSHLTRFHHDRTS